LANILIVSIFRFKNGTEGGMGQWYNVHSQFLPFVIAILLLKSINYKFFTARNILKIFSLLIIIIFSIAGYCCDFLKAQYVKPWKDQFVVQAFDLLISPEEINNKENSMNTMLWNYPAAKHGIEFLFANSLWIFNNKELFSTGITTDSWVTADKHATIICPPNFNLLKFNAWRPENQPQSSVLIKTQNGKYETIIEGSSISINLGKIPYAQVLATDSSNPINSVQDKRKLIFVISGLTCEEIPIENPNKNLINITDWGPKSAKTNVNPNPQIDGGIGFWINAEFSQDVIQSTGVDLFLGDYPAKNISIQNNLITGSFHVSILSTSGHYNFYLINKSDQSKSVIGTFLVE
jgi:hypothetical protein